MKIDKYDVAIGGGGPAGTVAALTLARAGYAVAVIETSKYEHPRVGETLPPPTRAVLTRLGLWYVRGPMRTRSTRRTSPRKKRPTVCE